MSTRLLCRVGLHKWQHLKGPEGEPYRSCRRCRKDGDYEGFRAALRAGWWT